MCVNALVKEVKLIKLSRELKTSKCSKRLLFSNEKICLNSNCFWWRYFSIDVVLYLCVAKGVEEYMLIGNCFPSLRWFLTSSCARAARREDGTLVRSEHDTESMEYSYFIQIWILNINSMNTLIRNSYRQWNSVWVEIQIILYNQFCGLFLTP